MFRRPFVPAAVAALAAMLAALPAPPAAAQSSAQSSAPSPAPAESTPATAPADPQAAPRTPEEKIEALDQQIKILARQIEIEKEAATAAAAAAPASAAGPGGFELRSADGAFRVRFRGYLHADSRYYAEDDEARGTDTFLLRRARPIFEATTFKIFDFRIMADFGNGTAVIQDAYFDARFSRPFNLRVGKQKGPVGQERLASATDILFIERALPTALLPNRDVGVLAYGDLTPWLAYQAGVFDGVIDGGSTDTDTTDSKDLEGRLVFSPFKATKHERLQSLSVGIGGTRGKEVGTAAAPALAQIRSGGQLVWFRFRGDGTAAGTTIADGDRTRATVHAQYYLGPLGVQAEYASASHEVRRAAVAERLTNRAWQVTGSWILTGETATGRVVSPRQAFDTAKGGFGAFEIVARANALAIDDDAFPIFATIDSAARKATAGGVGINWYLNRTVKISADYELTRFDGGAPAGADRAREHSVFTRFQIAY
jgi:phosphate-selective porin OprO and OprP